MHAKGLDVQFAGAPLKLAPTDPVVLPRSLLTDPYLLLDRSYDWDQGWRRS